MPLGRHSPCHLLLEHPWEVVSERSCRSLSFSHREVIWLPPIGGGAALKCWRLLSSLRGNKGRALPWEAVDHQV